MQIEKRYLSLPLTAQLEVTDCCNHRCIHCYNLDSEIQNRPMRHVDDETVLRCAQKLIDNQIFGVIVTGGEPLIKKELTKQVISLLKEHQIRVSFNSNLTLFDDDFIAFLKEKKVGVLTSCPSAVSSSFAKLVGIDNYARFETNLKKLVEAGGAMHRQYGSNQRKPARNQDDRRKDEGFGLQVVCRHAHGLECGIPEAGFAADS